MVFLGRCHPRWVIQKIMLLKQNIFINWFHGSDAFKNLIILDLSVNNLRGPVPSMISLQSLFLLNLSSNSLSSTINPDIGYMQGLEYLYLSNNSLTGPIPSSFHNLTKLTVLSLRQNFLNGPIPSGLSNLTMLNFLHFGSNSLTGSIPDELGRLRYLEYLHLDNNRFSLQPIHHFIYINILLMKRLTGPIPVSLSALRKLTLLSVQYNQLVGPVPASFSALGNLTILSLNSNQLTGTVPTTLSSLRKLQILQLQSNRLRGSISGLFNSSLQQALANVDLSDNSFSGAIPPELFQLPSLITVAAAVNCFSGRLPITICEAKSINIILFDGLSSATSCQRRLWDPLNVITGYLANPMEGEIPSCVWELSNLTTLHLSGNRKFIILSHFLSVIL